MQLICPCEKKMWMFYFLFTTYQCIYTVGCYKNIMLIPSVNSFIILVLNHWFLNFFSKQYLHVFVILVCFFEADSEAKTYLFKLFFYIEDLAIKAFFFAETWPSTLISVVTLTFHLPFILLGLGMPIVVKRLKYMAGILRNTCT